MRLLIFTLRFPFDGSEPFLRHELSFLSKEFDIIVVPLFSDGYLEELPDGVSLDLSLAQLVRSNDKRQVWPLLIRLGAIFSAIFRHGSFGLSAITDVVGFVHYGALLEKWAYHNVKEGDVLYTYWFERMTYGLARFKKQNPKYPLVSRAHGFDVYEGLRKQGFIPFRKETLRQIDKVFCISENGKKEIGSRHGFKDKLEVAKLGIWDVDRRELTSEKGKVVFVSCSRIVSVKRVDLIAKTMVSIGLKYPDLKIEWHHFGDGDEMEKVKQALGSLPENLGCDLHGQVTNSEILEFYNANYVHAFINMSHSEGIPVSIMEAHAFGIPVLATNVGGVSEIVNESNGRLLNSQFEINEAVTALNEIVEDESLRRGARMNYESNFRADKNFQDFSDHIRNLVK